MCAEHVRGLDLCRRFYREVVRPRLDPHVPHSAALLGRGSEVLGFDDEMSTDHDCEARVLLFVRAADVPAPEVPELFEGRRTRVEVHTVGAYFRDQLGWDAAREPTVRDWFTFPEQKLRMLTAGEVFHDEVGLQKVRDQLAYYPRDVWLYLQLAAWWRVHPEMNLAGRAGFVGDELGSALIGSQLVQDLMRLCFLMERQYAPYSKWFGTAFSRLSCAAELSPSFSKVLAARSWREREEALMEAYTGVARVHNSSGITAAVTTGVEQMWGRPFKVVWGDFPGALLAAIEDPDVRRIADHWPVGGIDRIRDVLWSPQDRRQLLGILDQAATSRTGK